MKTFFLAVSILFSYLVASPTSIAVVVNAGSNDASIVDLTSFSTITTVACGNFPQYVAVTADGSFALVTNTSTAGPNGVTAIDLKTFATTPIDLGLGSSSPVGIVITPTNQALICNAVTTQVSVIDIPTLSVQPSIPVPGLCGPNKNSIVLATGIPSVPDLALVALNSDMVAIDIASLTPTSISLGGTSPSNIAVSKNQKKAFVLAPGISSVVPIDLTTLTPGAPILLVSNPVEIAIADDFDLALVATSDNTVIPIDLVSLTPQAPIAVGITPIYIGISGNTAFVANVTSSTVTPIDLNSLLPSTDIVVGTAPVFVEPSLGLNPIMVVGDAGENKLSTFNPITFALGPDISVGTNPHDIAFALLPPTPISPPYNLSGRQKTIDALLQKDIVNIISWDVPLSGIPAFYKLYRDSALTNLIATIDGNETAFYDHGRKECLSYTYFIVAVDATGNVSSSVSITVP